jgi:hypothetical protein
MAVRQNYLARPDSNLDQLRRAQTARSLVCCSDLDCRSRVPASGKRRLGLVRLQPAIRQTRSGGDVQAVLRRQVDRPVLRDPERCEADWWQLSLRLDVSLVYRQETWRRRTSQLVYPRLRIKRRICQGCPGQRRHQHLSGPCFEPVL